MSRIIAKNSPSGYKNPNGNIVLSIQKKLNEEGFDTNGIDGIFGVNTENAVSDFQKKYNINPDGCVDFITWSRLMNVTSLPSLFDRCLAVTSNFEGHGFTKVAGNFDDAYLTWGVIGYTLKHGDLRAVINLTLSYDPNAVRAAFGNKADEFLTVLNASKTKQKEWANSISVGAKKYNVKTDWAKAFENLGNNVHCQRAQLEVARTKYWKKAESIFNELELSDELGLALAFDIAVQNGSFNSSKKQHLAEILKEVGNVNGEAYRRAVAEATALGSNPAYQKDVRSRKMTFATGRGSVHGANYLLNDWCLAAFPAFDIEVETVSNLSKSVGWTTKSLDLEKAENLIPSTDDDEQDFVGFIKSLGLIHFKPYEFLVKGSSHTNPNSNGFGKNTNPPRNKWSNIAKTAKVLDILRARLDAPIITLSVYRSPAYNSAVGGATNSLHKEFNAIDFVCQGNSRPSDWADALRGMRSEGIFQGGIGLYKTFVHVDTRGYNSDW